MGTHGQKNWGDELLLKTFLYQLHQVVGRFYVNSYDPPATADYCKDYNVTTFHTRQEPLKLVNYLLRSKAVIFGGGSIIKELYTDYGGKRYQTLQIINHMTMAARAIPGRLVILSNIGVGPIETEKGKQWARKIINRAHFVAVRDSLSAQLVKKLKTSTPTELTPDAVFSLDRAYFGLAPKAAPAHDRRRVVINLCRNIATSGRWPRFMEQVAADVTKLANKYPDIEIIGLPMQARITSNDDMRVLEDLRTRLVNDGVKANFILVEPKSITEVAEIIDQANLVIAERLHVIILATILHTPFIALEYDVKVTGVVKDLGLIPQGINIREDFPEGEIYRRSSNLLEKSGITRKHLREVAHVKKRQADQYFNQLKAQITGAVE